ncbi:MAG: hypothetical protein AB7O39_04515 [Flavobacteriaceae bacterium]
MEAQLAREIIACLPKGRTIYSYYRDKYTVELVRSVVGERMAIRDLRQTHVAGLLERPKLKAIIAARGDGVLTREDLLLAEADADLHYVLTLGLWGSEHKRRYRHLQLSRRGLNLVLQLNFVRSHDRAYADQLKQRDGDAFQYGMHPICRSGRNTLAWARIDLDLEKGEALIEEIQSDWIRLAAATRRWNEPRCEDDWRHRYFETDDGQRVLRRNAERYFRDVLEPHTRIWPEAMLSAAIWFLTHEIGIRTIWYHDEETGAKLKNIAYRKPPRSLYTDLPRRFCFAKTSEVPSFLVPAEDKRINRWINEGNATFWRLRL